MKRRTVALASISAAALTALALTNASALADPPSGKVKLVAHRGISQLYDRSRPVRKGCTSTRIEPPVHDFLENTTRSIETAVRMGADLVEMDVSPTSDGHIVAFHDNHLDCRTDGSGRPRHHTLDEIRTLDAGYGYTVGDSGNHPFRGRGQRIPSLDEALEALHDTPVIYNFKTKEPEEADRLSRALRAAHRDVEAHQDAFYGPGEPVRRIRQIYPRNWAFSLSEARECTSSYIAYGWSGVVPDACRNGTLLVPLNYRWAMWGWPNRLGQRMQSVGAHVIVIGPYHGQMTGLTMPDQLREIPLSFKGYVWIDDFWTIGPAARPERDIRSESERRAAELSLERRHASLN